MGELLSWGPRSVRRPAFSLTLSEVADEVARTRTREGFTIGEAEALGKAIATHFEWDGDAILEAAIAALTDANYHTVAAELQAHLDGMRADDPAADGEGGTP
jgi:hypothetical protein